jgi:RecA/RadA recombinase
MAKKEIKKFEFSKIGSILENISKSVSIHIDKEIKEKNYISTGSMTLNAALSGTIYGGISVPGISVFGGPEASGKTFLALNIMRESMALGYSVIYIDTEHAISRSELPSLGIDNSPENFVIIRGNQVEELNITLTTLISELKKAKLEGYELPKQIWALDSLGQLSSKKMKEDLLKGDIKAEVGNKAKAIGSFFVSITEDLAHLGIPLVVNNQTYETMEMFSQTVMKGGKQLYYSANNITFLTKAKLKEDSDEMDIGSSSGIIVTARCVKNRHVKPKQVKFEISFNKGMNKYKGLENFCRPEYYDKIGIAQGKEEVDKSTGELQFKPGGNRWFVRHLGKSVTTKQLFTSEVFTKEALDEIDKICQSYFKYKSFSEMEESEKDFEQIMDADADEHGFSDDVSADDLFS